ncbi:MAG TPA: 2,4'-dihydroxyacetophenone dioxygenase family protein [Burkholderiaceae bacterium]|nr:2,4'-dihydroxyacetophenone dioxygenase family protein [Burkholderiaceae bacterium]
MVSHGGLGVALIDDESLPWVPFEPYGARVVCKPFRLDPVHGEMIVLMKVPAGAQLARHRHGGRCVVYTIAGRWKHREEHWIAGPGSLVVEAASSTHTPVVMRGSEEVITLNVMLGDFSVLDENGEIVAVENWKSVLQRYEAYCERAGIAPRDLAAF